MYSEAAREGAISALRAGANTCAGADAVGDAMRGLTGNFRKLEVDWNLTLVFLLKILGLEWN